MGKKTQDINWWPEKRHWTSATGPEWQYQ